MALLIATVLPAAAQEPFKRNLEQVGFVPKGAWIAGVSVSYQQSDQNNYQFLVFENINGDTYTFKVSPTVLFSFKDNLAAGGRFSYSRQRTHLSSADIVLDSETSYNIDNLYSISHNYHGTALFRAYFSLGRSTRFGMFNEVQLELGGGQSCAQAADATLRALTNGVSTSTSAWLPVWWCSSTTTPLLRSMSEYLASITGIPAL